MISRAHRFLALAALGLAVPAACSAAPTEAEFTRDMLARFKAADSSRAFRISSKEVLVIETGHAGSADEGVINLHRIFSYCQNASAADCETTKNEFASKTLAGPPKAEAAALRVIVRDQQYLDYALGLWKDGKRHVFHRPLGADLHALLAVDGAETIALATPDNLEALGLDEARAWAVAMTQTKAVLPRIPEDTLAAHQPVAFEEYEYLGSLLADLETWKIIAEKAGPDLFVTVTSDGFVFAAFMPDGPDLDAFAKVVIDDCSSAPRCISSHIYRFRDGAWVIAK